jgi:hypothetical protein
MAGMTRIVAAVFWLQGTVQTPPDNSTLALWAAKWGFLNEVAKNGL